MDPHRSLPSHLLQPATSTATSGVPRPLPIITSMSLAGIPAAPMSAVIGMPLPVTPLPPVPASAPMPPLPQQPMELVAEHPIVYGGAGQGSEGRRPGVEYHHITVILPSDRQLFMVPGPLQQSPTGSLAVVQFPPQPAAHITPRARVTAPAPTYALDPVADQVFFARPARTHDATGQPAADNSSGLTSVTVFRDCSPVMLRGSDAPSTSMPVMVTRMWDVDENAPLMSGLSPPTTPHGLHTSRQGTAAARGSSGRGRGRGRGARQAAPKSGSRKRSTTTADDSAPSSSAPRKRANVSRSGIQASGLLAAIPESTSIHELFAAHGLPASTQQAKLARGGRRRSKSDSVADDGLGAGTGAHVALSSHPQQQPAAAHLHLQDSVDQILQRLHQGSSAVAASAVPASSQLNHMPSALGLVFPSPFQMLAPPSMAPMPLPNPHADVGSGHFPMSLPPHIQQQLAQLPAPGLDIPHLTRMFQAVPQSHPLVSLTGPDAQGPSAPDCVYMLSGVGPQSSARTEAGPGHQADAPSYTGVAGPSTTLGTGVESSRAAAGNYSGTLMGTALRTVNGNVPDPTQHNKTPETQ